jgi:hypothetical protein
LTFDGLAISGEARLDRFLLLARIWAREPLRLQEGKVVAVRGPQPLLHRPAVVFERVFGAVELLPNVRGVTFAVFHGDPGPYALLHEDHDEGQERDDKRGGSQIAGLFRRNVGVAAQLFL